MYAKKKNRTRLWLLVLTVIVAVGAVTGSAYAKYKKTLTYSGTLTFKAELGSLDLAEHIATRNADGSYTLNGEEVLASELPANAEPVNTYQLIPGLDIPKDPRVIVSNKTSIEAYLFVEIVDTLAEKIGDQTYRPITYQVSADWKELSGVTGKHGGKVYVYRGTGTEAAALDETFDKDKIQILAPLEEGKPETVRVSQYLNTQLVNDGDDILTFYAAMGETALGTTPAEVYEAIFKNAP